MKSRPTILHSSRRLFLGVAAAIFAGGIQVCSASTILFSETFSLDAANWKIDSGGTTNATWVSSGGDGGGAYISRNVAAGTTGVILRGQNNFDSSNDGFVFNWIDSNVDFFSVLIRHDASTDLTFNLRFADSANSPGASTVNFTISPNTWTPISIPIVNSSEIFQSFGGSDFANIFDAIGNIQLSLVTSSASSVNVDFDTPTVTTVPEPSVLSLGVVATIAFAMIRRRR